jgi:hypothetical protein
MGSVVMLLADAIKWGGVCPALQIGALWMLIGGHVAPESDLCHHLCDRNSDFFHDLILMEVLELNLIVRFIVRSVCHFFCSC